MVNLFDSAFLSLYLINKPLDSIKHKCMNPFSVKTVDIVQSELFDKIADLNIFAINLSLIDGAVDKKNPKVYFLTKFFKKSLTANFERLSEQVTDFPSHLRNTFKILESENSFWQIEKLADALEQISCELFNSEHTGKIVRNMICVQYLLDAFEDYFSDLKNHRKNPLFFFKTEEIPLIVEHTLIQYLEELLRLSKGLYTSELIESIIRNSLYRKFLTLKEEKWCERQLLRHTGCEEKRHTRRDQESLQGSCEKVPS